MDKISKVNDIFWQGFFHYMRHICDNVPILLLVFGAFAALIVMIPTLILHKKYIMTRTFFIIEGIGALSVHGMLMHLPLLHTRIHTALSTASSIIMSSQTYLSAFQDKSGISVKRASDIVYYLWYMSPHDMESFTVLNPSLLYEKVYKTFMEERYFFGYINTDWLEQKSLVYLLIAAAGIILGKSLMDLYDVSRSFFLVQCLVFLLAVLLSKNGTIVFLAFFTFSFYCYTRLLFFLADRKKKSKNKKFK